MNVNSSAGAGAFVRAVFVKRARTDLWGAISNGGPNRDSELKFLLAGDPPGTR